MQLVDAITGDGEVAAADPALWSDLPVLPLIQPAAVFAVSESLRSVMATPHRGVDVGRTAQRVVDLAGVLIGSRIRRPSASRAT